MDSRLSALGENLKSVGIIDSKHHARRLRQKVIGESKKE
jgi:hypothetical protein